MKKRTQAKKDALARIEDMLAEESMLRLMREDSQFANVVSKLYATVDHARMSI